MDGRRKNATRNLLFGFLNKILQIVLPFVTRTALIYVLGVEYVGLNALFVSLLNVLSLAELGIGSAMVYSMYRPFADGDNATLSALLALYKKLYRFIGLAVLVIGLGALPFLPYLVHGSLPIGIDLYVLYIIYLVNSVIGYFLFAYRQSAFIASQRTDILSNINSSILLLSSITQIALLIAVQNYYAYIIVLPIFTCVSNIVTALLFQKRFPYLACRGKISPVLAIEIKRNVVGILTQKVGTIALSSAPSIIVSAFLGLTALGLFNNYQYMITALFSLLAIIQTSIIPSVGNSLVSTERKKNYADFRKFLFMYTWILSCFAIAFLCLAQPFVEIWLGDTRILPFNVVIVMSVYIYTFKMNDMVYVYREAAGIWREGMFIPLVAAVVNVIVSILLVRLVGLPGALVGSIVSLLMVYTPWYTRVLFVCYFDDKRKWLGYLGRQFRYLAVCLVAASVTYSVVAAIPLSGILGLLVKGVTTLLLSNIMLLLCEYRTPEFRDSARFISGLVVRERGPKNL